MNEDYDGAPVFDGTDEKVGTVERTYVDDNDVVRFVAVKTGTLFHKHRLIPTESAEMDDDGLHLPYSKSAIDDGPTIEDPDETLEGDILQETRSYYGESVEETSASSGALPGKDDGADDEVDTRDIPSIPAASGETAQSLGEVRDKGDVIEVPVVEERLVRQPVVTEVVRVKKSTLTDESSVAADVRKESLQVDADDGVVAKGGTDDPET